MGRRRVLRGLLAAVATASACSLPARADDAKAAPLGLHYALDVAPDLSRVDVTARFDGWAPRRLALAGGGTLACVRLRPGADLEPESDGVAVRVAALDGNGALSWTVDLDALVAAGLASRTGGDVDVTTGELLLRPLLLPEGLVVTATIRTAPGIRSAVPWPLDGSPATSSDPFTTRHRLDRTVWNMVGHAFFGRFARETIVAHGASFDLVTLSGATKATPAGIRAWIRAAIDAIAGLYGRFPVPRVGICVTPVRGGPDDPVPFGSTWYGGGPHVILLLADGATDASLRGEWVALHELLHTTTPSIATEDAWLSEGFVTYYQEVLRARARFQDAATSWRLLEEGFGRGRATGTGRTLRDESREMRRTRAYWPVYWGGAALALRLDAELRRTSGGTRSLDDVMRHWARRAGNEDDVSADALIADADAFLGGTTFRALATPALASSSFPDVSATYGWLGVRFERGRFVPVPGAPGAAARDAIVRGAGAEPARVR